MSRRKIITLTSFLIITFALLLGFWTIALAACNDNCKACLTTAECNGSDAHCTWYEAKSECFKGLETDWPPAPGGIDLTGESTLPEFINYVFLWGVLLGGLAAFLVLILAGFQYLTSVGDPTKMQEARNRITSAIVGLVLLLSTFIILNTLNPELTTLVMPSTTPGGFTPGSFESGGSRGPCKEVKFYKETGWHGSPLLAAYFKDPNKWTNLGLTKCSDISFPDSPEPGTNCTIEIKIEDDACDRIGDAGWWIFLKDDIRMGSVKIVGACVITAYDDNDCKDNPSNISTSDSDITTIFSGYKHSMKLTDRSPPTPPVVENITGQPLFAHFDSSSETCQVRLNGNLLETGGNPYVRVSLRIGTTTDKMMDFPPKSTEWDPPYPDPWPSRDNFDYWDTEEGQVLEAAAPFVYVVTGLEAPVVNIPFQPGVIYYWTTKACGTQGTCTIADEDPDNDPIEDYPSFELKIYDRLGPVPPICRARNR